MDAESRDSQIRAAAFAYLGQLTIRFGEVLPATHLRSGLIFEGARVPLMGPQGIFKPALLDLPLSITTVPVVAGRQRPYQDELAENGLLRY
ncbi:MAG: hypothetical protein ACP5PW_08215, partial [Candidatus Dormibacteria bacterium]